MSDLLTDVNATDIFEFAYYNFFLFNISVSFELELEGGEKLNGTTINTTHAKNENLLFFKWKIHVPPL